MMTAPPPPFPPRFPRTPKDWYADVGDLAVFWLPVEDNALREIELHRIDRCWNPRTDKVLVGRPFVCYLEMFKEIKAPIYFRLFSTETKMDGIQLAPYWGHPLFLKLLRFTPKGMTINRRLGDGLQLVMGYCDVPTPVEIAALTHDPNPSPLTSGEEIPFVFSPLPDPILADDPSWD